MLNKYSVISLTLFIFKPHYDFSEIAKLDSRWLLEPYNTFLNLHIVFVLYIDGDNYGWEFYLHWA